MIILSKISIEKLLQIEAILTQESRELLLKLPKPSEAYGKSIPDNLNGLSIGQLFDLQEALSSENIAIAIEKCAEVVLDVPSKKVWRYRADRALGFTLWVLHEIENIAKLWASIKTPPSPEAIQAGIDQMESDNFDTIDWFARRMGITNHEEVMSVPWVRIFKCMKRDNDNAAFEERLRQVYMNKHTKK
jgi:hypothetical protein